MVCIWFLSLSGVVFPKYLLVQQTHLGQKKTLLLVNERSGSTWHWLYLALTLALSGTGSGSV